MIFKLLDSIIHQINKIRFTLNSNIHYGKGMQIKHTPIIDIRKKSKLIMGKNVTLNSKNSTYHVNMFAPVKIFAKSENAIVIIGDNTRIHGSCIHASRSIQIGKNCLIAANCQIFDNSGHDIYSKNRLEVSASAKEIMIEDNVWIGAGAIILPGSIIKQGSVVAAGSVVRGVFEENSLIAGNPATLVKKINTYE